MIGDYNSIIIWANFRIYYLFQGPTRITRFKEDRILGILFRLSPSVSGAVTLLHVTENFIFYGKNPLLFNYRVVHVVVD